MKLLINDLKKEIDLMIDQQDYDLFCEVKEYINLVWKNNVESIKRLQKFNKHKQKMKDEITNFERGYNIVSKLSIGDVILFKDNKSKSAGKIQSIFSNSVRLDVDGASKKVSYSRIITKE